MPEKNIPSRVVNKHDTQANWEKAINFTPKAGELIIYDIDENYTYPRFKVGDGVNNVNDLIFTDERLISQLETKADKNNTILINNGATTTLEEIFGEGPYTIEFTQSPEDNATAGQIAYDNSASGLNATNVQSAIDAITNPSGTDYSTYKLRNIAIVDTVPTEMNEGDIALVYVAGE